MTVAVPGPTGDLAARGHFVVLVALSVQRPASVQDPEGSTGDPGPRDRWTGCARIGLHHCSCQDDEMVFQVAPVDPSSMAMPRSFRPSRIASANCHSFAVLSCSRI